MGWGYLGGFGSFGLSQGMANLNRTIYYADHNLVGIEKMIGHVEGSGNTINGGYNETLRYQGMTGAQGYNAQYASDMAYRRLAAERGYVPVSATGTQQAAPGYGQQATPPNPDMAYGQHSSIQGPNDDHLKVAQVIRALQDMGQLEGNTAELQKKAYDLAAQMGTAKLHLAVTTDFHGRKGSQEPDVTLERNDYTPQQLVQAIITSKNFGQSAARDAAVKEAFAEAPHLNGQGTETAGNGQGQGTSGTGQGAQTGQAGAATRTATTGTGVPATGAGASSPKIADKTGLSPEVREDLQRRYDALGIPTQGTVEAKSLIGNGTPDRIFGPVCDAGTIALKRAMGDAHPTASIDSGFIANISRMMQNPADKAAVMAKLQAAGATMTASTAQPGAPEAAAGASAPTAAVTPGNSLITPRPAVSSAELNTAIINNALAAHREELAKVGVTGGQDASSRSDAAPAVPHKAAARDTGVILG